jgi:hypothetical protein
VVVGDGRHLTQLFMNLIKQLNVNGIRVNVWSDGTIKIYGKNKSESDVIMKYIEAEGLLDGVFNSNEFKNKRN